MNKDVSTTTNGTSTSNNPTKGTPTSTPSNSALSTSTPTKNTSTNGNLYTNNQLHFSLELPEDWNGKYLVVEGPKSVSFSYKPEIAKHNGFLFKIDTVSNEEWLDHGKDLPGPKIGENNGIVFIYIHASENPYGYEANDIDSQGFIKIAGNNQILRVIKTFKILEQYSLSKTVSPTPTPNVSIVPSPFTFTPKPLREGVPNAEWLGEWSLDESNDYFRSTVNIASIDQHKILFSLNAFRMMNPEKTNVHLGHIFNGEAAVKGNNAEFTDGKFQMKILLDGQKLHITTNSNDVAYFGAGVVVNGIYSKINKEKVQPIKNDYLNKDSLCYKNEEQYFGFTVAGNNKLLSICVSNNPSYLVYRYGQQDHIELEYPNNKEDSWNSFNYSYYLRGGGTANSGLDLNYLSFNNGDFKYELFEEYNADNAETHIGIHVADKNTNKVTTIEGIEKMKIGSLVNFRGSKVKEILFDR
jgi:hypothetical protein